jgi:hypothetical protein
MTIAISGTTGITLDGQFNSASSMGFKNRIINGAMVIDQRNAGASVTPASDQYLVDRFAYGSSQASKFTAQQNAGSVTPPTGFSNYLGFTVASAVTVGAGDYFFFYQRVEGFNTYDLAWGTANAQTVTLSFWVRSSLTGTFGGVIQNAANNRSYPFTYTISSANTWTSISVTIAGDTSGTWVGATNSVGLQIRWGLGVGSTFSGTAGAWAGSNLVSATGAVSVVGTSGATFYITGVQLEKGSTATSFDYRPYGTELALCQRYFQTYVNANGACIPANGVFRSGSRADVTQILPVVMRSAPTIATTNIGNINVYSGGSAGAASAFADNGSNANTVAINISASGTEGRGVYLQASGATAGYTLSSEL